MGLVDNMINGRGIPKDLRSLPSDQVALQLNKLLVVVDSITLKNIPTDLDHQLVSPQEKAAWNSLAVQVTANGSVTLAEGQSSVAITGLTSDNTALLSLNSPAGTFGATWSYQIICATDSLQINALHSDGSINTVDTSTLYYTVFPAPIFIAP